MLKFKGFQKHLKPLASCFLVLHFLNPSPKNTKKAPNINKGWGWAQSTQGGDRVSLRVSLEWWRLRNEKSIGVYAIQ